MVYLNRSELHYRPDSLGNHVEVLSTSRRDQRQIPFPHLKGKAASQYSFIMLSYSMFIYCSVSFTLSFSRSSAATSTSPALRPFLVTGNHSSLGLTSTLGFSFTTGGHVQRPIGSSLP